MTTIKVTLIKKLQSNGRERHIKRYTLQMCIHAIWNTVNLCKTSSKTVKSNPCLMLYSTLRNSYVLFVSGTVTIVKMFIVLIRIHQISELLLNRNF